MKQMKLKPKTKRIILGDINGIDPNMLIDKLATCENLTIKECLEADLNVDVIEQIPNSKFPDLIQYEIQNKMITQEELESFGVTKVVISGVEESVDQGKVNDGSNNVVPSPEIPLKYKKEMTNISKIKSLLIDGKITEENIMTHIGIRNPELIERIRNYNQVKAEWTDDLPELPKDKTDIYFLGWTGSGKSCFIASLLAYCDHVGLSIPTAENSAGDNYKKHLINQIDEGYLPESTPEESINFMPFILRNPDNKSKHPLNIIEMAGELFRKASEGDITQLDRAYTYLQNNNRKVIYYVVDYSLSGRQQSLAMQDLNQLLEKENVYQKTDAIFLIVNKIDKRKDKNVAPLDEAEEFIQSKYTNFRNQLRDIKDTYQIPLILIPFCIGETYVDMLIDKNRDTNEDLNRWPKNVVNKLLKYTQVQNKRNYFSYFNKK